VAFIFTSRSIGTEKRKEKREKYNYGIRNAYPAENPIECIFKGTLVEIEVLG
jgi:hypothetical protein